MTKHIVYQGEAGAYSHLATQTYFPDHISLPRASFSQVFKSLTQGEADLAMIPVENSLAGRVSDIYHLLPEGGLYIVAEHYLPIHHQLLAVKGAVLSNIKTARSHPMALSQVRHRLDAMNIVPHVDIDTAGAARKVGKMGDKTVAAIASSLAAEEYGLDILAADIEDEPHNTTRFLTLARQPLDIAHSATKDMPVVTSFVFKVRNVPSALYKALGGFATNGINMTKLESYMREGSFTATQFYVDVEGHPEDENMRYALEELAFFSENITILGTYPADILRSKPL